MQHFPLEDVLIDPIYVLDPLLRVEILRGGSMKMTGTFFKKNSEAETEKLEKLDD